MNKNRKDRVEKERGVPLEVDGGVKVLSEKTAMVGEGEPDYGSVMVLFFAIVSTG